MIAFTFVALMVLIFLAIPVAAVMGILALSLNFVFTDMPLWRALGEVSWGAFTEFTLLAIPLYILLGELFLRTGIAEQMYTALSKWVSWLPGGLMHANIASCTLFSATSGSSVATSATIGTLAIPQQKKYGYNERLFLGSIAAGGTLGILLPPSINMIIYGVLTNSSIPQLYLAAIVPGLLMAAIFALTILIQSSLFNEGEVKIHATWSERIASLKHLVPPLIICVVIIGSIYSGIATPTESAALGVLAVLALAALRGMLNVQVLLSAFENTMRTTGMIMLIIVFAYFLNFVLSGVGLSSSIKSFMNNLGLSPIWTLIAVIIFYVILGCFMETLSMMIATIPIVAPIIFAAGYDPIWFGVVVMILVELAMITPPIGINLYVVQSIRPRGGISDVIVGALPFVVAMFAMVALLILFPGMTRVFL
ncbi:TRAP transporter large permease [Aerobium aerolatum]|uniref:TRAP transporter large permease protein n=1 Tax=Aquamicrobium aerolatum DSM 21857 TaxID=1121003 RepID=A0A1I3M031_9HYPH|nr:TRAP transporter large permease subunit [Aquamicrobium aerolatum]SFI90140.1 TRAP transporter, DctM subunit [Aquamicrobium aerolatum DSM 21857]